MKNPIEWRKIYLVRDSFTKEGNNLGKRRNSEEYLMYQKLANTANIMLMSIHMCLLIIFAVLRVRPMFYLNVVSVAVYAVNFYWVKKNLKVFFFTAYLEILVHMVFSTLFLGWKLGFQLYGFALILSIYYGEYLAKKIWGRVMHTRITSVIVVLLFLLLYTISFFVQPVCVLESTAGNIIIFTLNAVSVFLCMIIYLENYKAIVEQTENRLMEAAEKDALTKMHNRGNMQERLNYILEQKNENSEIAIAIMDIDDFKKVNDTYGHNAGDLILFEVAARIIEKEDKQVSACRWGGEEFLILSAGQNAYQNLVGIINELVQIIRNDKHQYQDQVIKVTISAGISVWENGEKIEHTISRADEYLYEAKKAGKNRYITKDRIW